MGVEPQKPNTVLIGKKPAINYVTAIVKLFNEDEMEEVVVKARGRNVCRAIEAIEMLKNMFLKDIEFHKVNIYSEELVDDKGNKRKVVAIEVVLRRGKAGS